MVARPPAIRLAGIHKSFGAVRANRGAALEVAAGEIHALVGENGAGKSTLMRILAGLFPPDAGTLSVDGRDVTGWSVPDAIAAGVGMVHQHFMLVPTLSVAENVVLGMEPRRGPTLDRGAAERRVQELGRQAGLEVTPDTPVAELSVGEAQRVEILKTLYRGARILILDEPTAVLSPLEVEELWSVLRGLRDAGGTVVLITHKLDEVVAISDAITVMRAGETVERIRTRDTTPAAIARAMVGREVALATEGVGVGIDLASMERDVVDSGRGHGTPREGAAEWGSPPSGSLSSAASVRTTIPPPPVASPPALRVRDLVVRDARGHRHVAGVSFDLAPGEIFGIAGVEGNGQTQLVEAIAGLAPIAAGEIRLDGHDLAARSVRDRADLGLSHIPEDRHRRGLVLDFSVADNLILGRQHRFARRGLLDRAWVDANAAEQIAAFDIRPADGLLPARALSGGNQQKVVVAREMGGAYSVLLAAQPTRGVDVGAIEFIHDRLRAARAAGKAVLLVSADLTELLALSDRVAVMFRGRFVTVLPRSQASAGVLGPYMTGADGEAVA